MRKVAGQVSNIKQVIKFYATWCQPCSQFSPIFEEVQEEYPGVEFISVDVDQKPELAKAFGVTTIPYVVVLRDGETVGEAKGVISKTKLRNLLDLYK